MLSDLAKTIKNGIITDNPTFVQAVGMCPALAVTTSGINGLGMGLATTAVLTCSNTVISLLRNFIPSVVRIPCFVIIISSFVTVVQLLMEAYLPSLNHSLGIFIPLIVVNCVILARAESFAFSNGPLAAAADGVGIGLGFAFALVIIGCIREFLGGGTLFGLQVLPDFFPNIKLMLLPPGGFFTLGAIMALLAWLGHKRMMAKLRKE